MFKSLKLYNAQARLVHLAGTHYPTLIYETYSQITPHVNVIGHSLTCIHGNVLVLRLVPQELPSVSLWAFWCLEPCAQER